MFNALSIEDFHLTRKLGVEHNLLIYTFPNSPLVKGVSIFELIIISKKVLKRCFCDSRLLSIEPSFFGPRRS